MRGLRLLLIPVVMCPSLTLLAEGTQRTPVPQAPIKYAAPKPLDPVLSYSTYVGPQQNYTQVVLAVNGTGTTCVVDGQTVSDLTSSGSQAFSTAFGNATNTNFDAVTTDAQGNCYVVGVGVIITTSGVFQGTPKQTANPSQFVAKFSSSGAVVFATYLAGSGSDTPSGIGINSVGDVYVTGKTTSNDFPTMNPYQPTFGGGQDDSFVAVLNPTGSALIYSTYLGGNGTDETAGIAVDSSNNAYVYGSTTSTNFPLVAAFQSSASGGFLTKFNSAGAPVYSTYFANGARGPGAGIAVDALGDAYITGGAPDGLPLVNPIQTSGSYFVSKFNPTGSALLYSTYYDGGGGLFALDSNDQMYLLNTGGTIPLVNPI